MLLDTVTFLHVLILVYWLGGDLGVFYLSRTFTDPNQTIAARQTSARLLLGLDLAPRFCLLLALPTGLWLASTAGWLQVPLSLLLISWLIALLWIGLVIHLHHASASPATDRWRLFDAVLRWGFSLAMLGSAWFIQMPVFLRLKLVLLAATVLLGLYIRRCLQPLGPALVALADNDPERANPLINASVGRSRPAVLCIWLAIAAAGFIGISKPL